MSQKLSIQDYYYQQKRIAEAYKITNNQAGCYVTHYPDTDLCSRCTKAKSCMKIRQQEVDKGYA